MNSAWTRRRIVLAVVLIGMSGGHTLAAPESDQPKKGPATTLAMIDIAFIFKNHKSFNDEMKSLEQRALAFQASMQATEAQLQLLKERLKQITNKMEYEKLEGELATQATEFQLSVRRTQQEVAAAEAKIYYDYYSLLQEETKKYSRSHGIHVVLKFARDPIKPIDNKSVTEGLARPIVFSDAPDITVDILKAMDAAVEVKAARKKTEESKPR